MKIFLAKSTIRLPTALGAIVANTIGRSSLKKHRSALAAESSKKTILIIEIAGQTSNDKPCFLPLETTSNWYLGH